MTKVSLATVISLDSPRASAAAQRRARRLSEAMRRHPAFIAQQRAIAVAEEAPALVGCGSGYLGGELLAEAGPQASGPAGWYDFAAELPAESAEAVVLPWRRR
ncbi:MAG: hypothetical protein K2Q25_04150 [Mycobacteriaceae bacterium]|nr:hypothetical protein [Mycobacteriaceae bacterium]